MNFDELYFNFTEQLKTKDFCAPLKIPDEPKMSSLKSKENFLHKGRNYSQANEFVKACNVLKKLLAKLNITTPEEKFLAAKALRCLGSGCAALSLTKDAVNFSRMSACLYDDKRDSAETMSNAIFFANGLENFSAADFQALYDEYKIFLTDVKPYLRKIYSHKKIRVGFMSGDFYNHPVIIWCGSLLADLDKNSFEIYCYSTGKNFDDVTNFIRGSIDGWRNISDLTDAAAAKIIRDDEIDILFDLSGHTGNNRLRVAAYRPATVQISGVGYVNSTGLDCFDYFLSDEICAGDESWFTETLIRLPHSHICYIPPKAEEILSAPCLRKGFVTFGCFNNFFKVTDSILVAWKKILDRVPESHLLLKSKTFSTKDGKTFVGERLKNFGFDLKRVDMRGYSKNYLREYNDVDIALDTFPYTGGITTCEALWMGVPVVSLFGERHGTRFGLSILKNVGVGELATSNFEDYIERAVALASDTELISILKKNLRGMLKKSPFVDAENYVRNVEKVFVQILNNAQKNFQCRSVTM